MANISFEYSPLSADFVITSRYKTSNRPDHKGIDLGVNGNPVGTIPVVAVTKGKVTVAGWVSGYGNAIYIDHGDGVITRYGHLHSYSVSVGQQVSAGSMLGYMGNTGISSGSHLHFEIRVNGDTIDPEPYIYGKKTLATSAISSDSVSTYNNVPYNPDSVAGRRLGSLASQPLHAYLDIWIGDKRLSSDPPKPNIIQHFEIDRLQGTGDTATFTIFDDNWDDIESLFSDAWNQVKIKYGYVDSKLQSDTYNMMLTNYSIAFNSTGVILSVSAISTGAVENLKLYTITTDSNNPSEAIRSICNAIGVTIDESDFISTDNVEGMTYNLFNENPISYIEDVILPSVQTSDREILDFYIDSMNKAHLRKVSFDTQSSREIKTFIFQKGYDSVVKDLTFDVKGVFGGGGLYGVSSGYQSSQIDSETKEESHSLVDMKSTTTTATGQGRHMTNSQSSPMTQPSGYTSKQLDNRLYYYLKSALSAAYEAQMTIIGDPTIKLLDHVRIINMTDSGSLHHTSGIYIVTGIVDSIDNGSMTTSLKLVRNGDINDGVELINPKVLVK